MTAKKLRPQIGDEFQIKKRYDNGGFEVIRVLEVRRRYELLVEDRTLGGRPNILGPRRFLDDRGWLRLQKFWKRHRAPAVR